MKNFKGFTLIEMIATVIILGVLVSVAMPKYLAVIDKSRDADMREILLKAYAGYHRLVIDEEDVSWPGINDWSRLGMSDPNNIPAPPRQSKFYIKRQAGNLYAEARSLDDAKEKLRIWLVNGSFEMP